MFVALIAALQYKSPVAHVVSSPAAIHTGGILCSSHCHIDTTIIVLPLVIVSYTVYQERIMRYKNEGVGAGSTHASNYIPNISPR